MSTRARRRTIGLGGGVVLLGLLPSLIGAPAGAATTGGNLRRTAGTTYCEVAQQAQAEDMQPAAVAKPKKQKLLDKCKPVPTKAAGAATARIAPASLTTGTAATTATAATAGMAGMAAMPGMVGTPGQYVTYQGPTDLAPAVGGSWDNASITIPGDVSAIHSVQLDNGKVLLMAGSGNQYQNLQAGRFITYLWDPAANTFTTVPTPSDMFCAGHTILANGNVLILGGTTSYPQYDANGNLVHDWNGSKLAYIYNTQTNSYQPTGSMGNARWYPTAVTLGNGNVVVAGGLDDQAQQLGVVSHNTDTVEQYSPATGAFSTLHPLDLSPTDPSYPVPAGATNSTRTLPYYPGLVLLGDGRLFYSGESNGDNGVRPGVWDPTTGGFQSLNGLTQPYQRNAGATVLLPPAQDQKVMIMGGGDYLEPTTTSTQIINLAGVGTAANPSPTYAAGPDLSAAKMYVGAVVLPDYTVFETNGASSFRQGGVHTAENYNPTTNAFTVWNSPTLDRLYHSESFLMPDGRVAVLGSQPLDGSFEMHISIFTPPYLYKGQRPVLNFGVTELSRTGGHQGYYDITTAPGSTLAHMSLVRPSATTHSTDPDQRLVDLPFNRAADGKGWTVDVPTNPNLTPPGWYMMFATDSLGRPSIAKWVHIS